MSKQELTQIQQQILKPQVIAFASFKLQIQKIDAKSELLKIVNIFLSETHDTLKIKKTQIPQKYVKKLRLLSILSYFYEQNAYNLLNLSKQLDLSKQQCMQLLIQANIYKLIAVHIDEQKNIITIRRSKIRQRQIQTNIISVQTSKINLINQKNNKILINVEKLCNSNGKQTKQKQLDYKSLLASFK